MVQTRLQTKRRLRSNTKLANVKKSRKAVGDPFHNRTSRTNHKNKKEPTVEAIDKMRCFVFRQDKKDDDDIPPSFTHNGHDYAVWVMLDTNKKAADFGLKPLKGKPYGAPLILGDDGYNKETLDLIDRMIDLSPDGNNHVVDAPLDQIELK